MEPLIGHSISIVCEPVVTGTHVLDQEWQTILSIVLCLNCIRSVHR